jgi:hypothetical protein
MANSFIVDSSNTYSRHSHSLSANYPQNFPGLRAASLTISRVCAAHITDMIDE